MKCGSTFLIPAPNSGGTPHLWIIVTEPDPLCVIVSLTTLRNAKGQTVLLRPGDHKFIRHETIVFFADAKIVNTSQLQAAVNSGNALPCEDCSDSTLKLIQDGVFASPYTARKIQTFCRERLKKAS